MRLQILTLFIIISIISNSQENVSITGRVGMNEANISFATIGIKELNLVSQTNATGEFHFDNIPVGSYHFIISAFNHPKKDTLIIVSSAHTSIDIQLSSYFQSIEEVVVSGSLKEVSKLKSITPIEVYTTNFFQKNPSNNLFECMSNINGVRPQLNCNICNTGDIHINGLEGPYSMVLIDGMPIVSSLSTVYGLSGIPNSIIDRVEIIRGPASAIYGSEAVGGVINVITKKASNAPKFSIDILSNTWLENNIEIANRLKFGKKIDAITGINYFNYSNPIDNNGDGFTDLTLQERISIFQKWQLTRKYNREFSIAGRYFYEDRWGGQTNWNKNFRGGDSIYGESIYTSRWEVFGKYDLPFNEKLGKMKLSFSYNNHRQNSYYGTTPFFAKQSIFFIQNTYFKTFKRSDFLAGVSFRHTFYDDNTVTTLSSDSITNQPFTTQLPGVFVQNEWNINEKNQLLTGARLDYNPYHGLIFTPRLGYKWNLKSNQFFRFNAGTGYRVVNLFTEDHAALTGARKVIINQNLSPETSYNATLNYYQEVRWRDKHLLTIDASAFYTYFTNKIVADYLTDPNKIIYDNLSGHAKSAGISLNLQARMSNGLKVIAGGTLMAVTQTENGIKQQQLLSENFTGTWTCSYAIKKLNLEIDYTGNIYSPMRLPVLNELDPRSNKSNWWSIQNIKFNYTGIKKFEFYTGVKNLLNWTPAKSEKFIIARAHDPFDKNVQFDNSGNAIPTSENPYGLTFDPSYVYGPNQGIRVFFGVNYKL